jgi:hypothetical protein
MKRLILLALLTVAGLGIFQSQAHAFGRHHGVGFCEPRPRWFNGPVFYPTRGFLVDYSAYFGQRYPHIHGGGGPMVPMGHGH